jgi:hypothetical protein
MAGSYGTIARANVLLVPKFDNLKKSIGEAVDGADTGGAGESIGAKLTEGIKGKLSGIGKSIGEALGVDGGALAQVGDVAGKALSGVGSAALGAVQGVATATATPYARFR